jgi:excisionase family DNA binding protein
MPETQSAYLTTRQTAARLGLSLSTINRLVLAGEISAHKKTTLTGRPQRNSPYLVDEQSVIEYETRRRTA